MLDIDAFQYKVLGDDQGSALQFCDLKPNACRVLNRELC